MRLSILIASLLLTSASQAAGPATATPIAVELFTSQGCSSCPPADALVERLAKEPNIVVITRPVTYWDRLGWKDTLARPTNTALQRGYDQRKIAGAGVYTPQIVVQGSAGAVGSNEGEIRKLIAREKAVPGPSVRGFVTPGGGRRVGIMNLSGTAQAIVATLKPETIVRIGSGENGGKTIRYTNVVLAESLIAVVRGPKVVLTIPASAMRGPAGSGYALILRESQFGRIIAARYI